MGLDNGSEVWLKLEGNNLVGLVKDCVVFLMIVEVEKCGEIKLGDVLIEVISGNIGIVLVMIVVLKGYCMKLLMFDNMSQECCVVMCVYGVELIFVIKE